MENHKPKLLAVRSKHSPLDLELVNIRLEERWDGLEVIQRSKTKLSDSGKYLELANIEKVVNDAFRARETGVALDSRHSAADGMQAALDKLQKMSGSAADDVMDWHTLEVRLLLGKLLLTLDRRDEALSHLASFGCHGLTPEAGWPIHALRLMAECCTLRGWALVRSLSSSGEKWQESARSILERQHQTLDCILLYFQELSNLSNPVTCQGKPVQASAVKISRDLEAAVHYTPLLHLILQDSEGAVQALRTILRAKENIFTRVIRLNSARQLALLLVRSPQNYTAWDAKHSKISPSLSCYQLLSRADFMLPEHRAEEVVLALSIAEHLVRQEAVQSRFPSDRGAYDKWHEQVTAVYDLAVLVLGSFGRQRLAELLEESMRFSFDDEHVWMQFGLALMSDGKYERAAVVLKRCLQQYPDNSSAALMICKIYINYLPDAEEVISFASALVKKHAAMAQGHLVLGLGHAMRARQCITESSRQEALLSSIEALQEAHRLDPLHPDCAVYYALQLAVQHRTAEAMAPVLGVLERNPVHHHAMWLLILLQTSLKSYGEALGLCNQALLEYPNDLAFALLKVEIEAAFSGAPNALASARSVLPRDDDVKEVCEATHAHMWLALTNLFLQNDQYEDATASFKKVQDGFSLHPQVLYMRGRLLAHEEKLEQAKGSYLGALAADPNHIACLLALSDVHLQLDNPTMTEQYISQALAVDPGSYSAWHRRGCVLGRQGEHERAAECFANALQIEAFAPISPFSDIPLSV